VVFVCARGICTQLIAVLAAESRPGACKCLHVDFD
jgi:hypothetical protein